MLKCQDSPDNDSCNQHMRQQKTRTGTSLKVQGLRLQASTAEGKGSVPSQETKIPHAFKRCKKKESEKENQIKENVWMLGSMSSMHIHKVFQVLTSAQVIIYSVGPCARNIRHIINFIPLKILLTTQLHRYHQQYFIDDEYIPLQMVTAAMKLKDAYSLEKL